MRFKNVQNFHINDLELDESNYRFMTAKDQGSCIKKIFESSPKNFQNIMRSLAEKDLDEPLLVWHDTENDQFIVLDGNRRLSALKVLFDHSLAPTSQLRQMSQTLREAEIFKAKFDEILAQVSTDKALIMNAIYDRHAAGGGISKIDWAAFSKARFKFDGGFDETSDWRGVALLMELMQDNNYSKFLSSTKFSFEVFRRIMNSAWSKGLFSKYIFLDNKQRLNKKHKTDKDKALSYIKKFLDSMNAGEITLSRQGDSYADKNHIEEYLAKFDIHSPDLNRNGTSDEKKYSNVDIAAKSDAYSISLTNSAVTIESDEKSEPSQKLSSSKKPTRVQPNNDIVVFLNENQERPDFFKFHNLYKSLTTISLNEHPVLQYVCAWVFFEALANTHSELYEGQRQTSGFKAYLNKKVNEWSLSSSRRGRKKDHGGIYESLEHIENYGNNAKHKSISAPIDAARIATELPILENLILKTLNQIAEKLSSERP